MGPQGVSYSVSSQLTHASLLIHISTGRCLAHVINLATQALLSAHSSAKHYDPAKPSDHEPDVDVFLCDEIGLVRAIVVKVSPLCYFYISIVVTSSLKGSIFLKAQRTSAENPGTRRTKDSTHAAYGHEGPLVIYI